MEKLRLWNQNNLVWNLHLCVMEGGKCGTGLAPGFWNGREIICSTTDSERYMKTKDLGWKENHGIQNIGIEGCQGCIIVDQEEALKIWGRDYRALQSAYSTRKSRS
jgi:hypothetical protein